MEVLVTGGAGFIGSNLVDLLVSERSDWKITVVDLLTYAGNFQTIEPFVKAEQITFEKIDICDRAAIGKLFEEKKFDLVFHLAAESHVDRSLYDASTFVNTNVLGTQNLVDAALAVQTKRFVHISTDEVYGSMGENERADESWPLIPSSPYSASKAASDLMVLAAYKSLGLPGVVTRCTNNYGPYQFPEKFIPLFTVRAMNDEKLPLYGDGKQMRSWIYVRDHCEALLSLAESDVVGRSFNIGGPLESELYNIDVANQILSALDKPSSLIEHVKDRPAHDRKYAVDFTAITECTGWEPKVLFKEGLEKTVNWYRENEPWWKAITSGEYKEFYEKHYNS